MADKQKVQPRCSNWWEKANERIRKERDEKEKQKKAKFLYKDLGESEDSGEDDEFLEALETIKKEQGVLDVLKWLYSKFEEAKEQRKLVAKSEYKNFCFDQPEEWKDVFIGGPMVKFLEILEVEVTTSNMCIPSKLLDFGLTYKASLIQDVIDDILLSNFSECKVCKHAFNSLPQHVSKSKSCKEKFSESDLQDLKYTQKLWKKRTNAECYQRNKSDIAAKYQERKSELAKKYLANREEYARKKADYYQKNKHTIRIKNSKYYAKNREEILKKMADHNKIVKEDKKTN